MSSDLVTRLRSINPSALFSAIAREAADEIERLQERCTEQAHWIDAAVSKCATQQCSRRAAQLLELQAEIKRLHADRDHWHEARRNAIEAGDELLREIERLRSDRREMLAQLRFIRTHLYAATVQRSPADDRIIADHIEQAYLRANEVIMEMEKSDV